MGAELGDGSETEYWERELGLGAIMSILSGNEYWER